ncbi:lysophospholipase L1-like esterase [Nocardiopsis arvandica]|uniref:Lysophospholipase L1-like esterase n=1 Tax=Nocardiopsis sinuspersici TaxID=501010 RepID=A0A7Z0BMA7_9ACTN|nr:GDSL-type esterase/lipase family protein [Nocardiopsis sinuspersici]NYH54244.1 lysophospholipase L1-like esterase [Nocardiopsis sinuspersici]
MESDETPRRRGHRRRGNPAYYLLRGTAAAVVAVLLATVVTITVSHGLGTELPKQAEQTTPQAPGTPFGALVDRIGVSRDGSSANVDLDGSGNSLSAQTLASAGWTPGREVVLLGAPLELPDYAPGRPDHLVSDGQAVRLGTDRYRSLTFLATATRTGGTETGDTGAGGIDTGGAGAEVHGTGRVVYTDGREQEFVLSVPDWITGPASEAALTLPYANSASGPDPGLGAVRLYARDVPVDPAREISHVVLPETGEGEGRIHLFSVGGREVGPEWTGTWARATSGYMEVGPWEDQTLRLSVRTTTGGANVRIRLDNTFADAPVTVGAASLAPRDTGAAVRGSAVPLTFGGRSATVIPAGGQVFSDPAGISVPPQTNVLVSVYLPERVATAPVHYASVDTNYTSAPGSGDHTLDTTGEPFTGRIDQWPFLTGVEVLDGPGAIVALGDSITDGVRSTRDAYSRWPDVLSARLAAQPGLPDPGVLNLGVSGNHVVRDGYPGEGVATIPRGVAMTRRVHRDVLVQNGVDTVVVFAGINDLRLGTSPEAVISGIGHITRLAHEYDLRVFVATLGPCGGELRCTAEVEQARQQVNTYLRSQINDPMSPFDGVWDFDAVLRDPQDPTRMRPAYDSGDHLHPGDAGLRALAESIDLYQLVGS